MSDPSPARTLCTSSAAPPFVGLQNILLQFYPFVKRQTHGGKDFLSLGMKKPPLKGEDGATAPEGFPAVRRIPFGMHQGEFVRSSCCPLWGKCRGSGKRGVVGISELLPFIEQHPLSQPCRFRSAVKSASSPNGGAKVGLARICPRFHKAIGACRETPQSGPLGLPAPLSGALFGRIQPPLKGEEGRASAWRWGLRYVEYQSGCTKANSHRPSRLPPGGSWQPCRFFGTGKAD